MAIRDLFIGGQNLNLLFNVFEGSNDGKMLKAIEEKGSIMKHGETPFEGDGFVKKPAGVFI